MVKGGAGCVGRRKQREHLINGRAQACHLCCAVAVRTVSNDQAQRAFAVDRVLHDFELNTEHRLVLVRVNLPVADRPGVRCAQGAIQGVVGVYLNVHVEQQAVCGRHAEGLLDLLHRNIGISHGIIDQASGVFNQCANGLLGIELHPMRHQVPTLYHELNVQQLTKRTQQRQQQLESLKLPYLHARQHLVPNHR